MKGNSINFASAASGVHGTVFLSHPLDSDATTIRTNAARDVRQSRSSMMLSNNNEKTGNPKVEKIYKRKNNCGSALRVCKTQQEKLDLINEEVEMAVDDGKVSNTFDYFRNILQLSAAEVECYANAVNK